MAIEKYYPGDVLCIKPGTGLQFLATDANGHRNGRYIRLKTKDWLFVLEDDFNPLAGGNTIVKVFTTSGLGWIQRHDFMKAF